MCRSASLPSETAFLHPNFVANMPAITPEEKHIVAEAGCEKNDDAILVATREPIDDASTDEETPAYLEGWDLWYLAMALMSSGFVLSLDNTILGT